MSYTLNLATGIVTRNADSKQVAPAQSTDDPDFVEYVVWVGNGNHPAEVNIPLTETVGMKITKLAFRNRFTSAEKITLDLASIDNPTASMQARSAAAALRVYLKDLDNATFIDLARSETITRLNMLVTFGLLSATRVNEILTAPIQAHEIPQEN